MTTAVTTDEIEKSVQEMPGAQLASLRVEKGYTTEYVAGKLHLRVRIIELLEADDYPSLPEPVFIKGYINAYAKLLDYRSESLLEAFNNVYTIPERKTEHPLWQSRRETHKAEHAVRWLTTLFAIGVLIAVAVWWNKNKDNEHIFPENVSHNETQPNKSETEIRLTDLSKMRSLLSSTSQYSSVEKPGE